MYSFFFPENRSRAFHFSPRAPRRPRATSARADPKHASPSIGLVVETMVRDHLGRHLPISRPTPLASSPFAVFGMALTIRICPSPSRPRQTTRDFHAAYLAACENLDCPPVRPLTDA